MITIPPGAVVETGMEYPPEVAQLRADLLAAIGDRFEQVRIGTFSRPEDVRAAVEAARAETAPLMEELLRLEVFGTPVMLVRNDNVV